MDPKQRANRTLLAIGIAAAWILVLHSFIVFWAMSEPARVEQRMDRSQAANGNSKAAAANPQGAGQTASVQPNGAPDSHAAIVALPQSVAVGWTHVAFPSVLLGSCVAIFASLVWAAVALNREYD